MLLPPPLQEDPLAVALTTALDDVLSPVMSVLDCLPAYLDPQLTPPDFLTWLASWVGAQVPEDWPPARGRDAVARAVELSQARGTVAGLRAYVEVVAGARAEVVDSGGVEWSQAPTDDSATPHTPEFTVRVHADLGTVDVDRLAQLLSRAKPAHVAHAVEIVPPHSQ
jgi:phage tail-like protein